MELLIAGVCALLGIAGAALLGPKVRIASPLVLVALGIAVSFLPVVPAFQVEPELILAGVLPPLLYSASVSMPAMNFRREFAAISGLSIVLVIASSVVLGLFFAWVIPGLDLWWGIALGAIVSPTDAVATSIVKRSPVSSRAVAILEGESLLNDATALVLLRTAVAGAAASVSLWGTIGEFAFAVAVAAALGFVVGRLNLFVRARIQNATVGTVISFTVPFLASIPAELLGASGLVAAVVAGLVTGRLGPRVLSPQSRQSDTQNWNTVELVLEGAVFLLMGLELSSIFAEVGQERIGVGPTLLIALGALLLTILVRAAYVAPLLRGLKKRSERTASMKPRLTRMASALADPAAAAQRASGMIEAARAGQGAERLRALGAGAVGADVDAGADADVPRTPGIPQAPGAGWAPGEVVGGPGFGRGAAARNGGATSDLALRADLSDRARRRIKRRLRRRRPPTVADMTRFTTRITRTLADIDYLVQAPLGWRDGAVVVWAGMRGAVTVAAAQTLPQETPNRSLLVLIAFVVAALSLLVQGGTLPLVIRWLKLAPLDADLAADERARLFTLLSETTLDDHPEAVDSTTTTSEDSDDVPDADRTPKQQALALIAAKRTVLLDARDDGTFNADTLDAALSALDADQIALQLQPPTPTP
ncbi:hypothetical protein B7R21_01470 [Subtercola boreus]|uniref:Cation/H+ exchanger transmembrane domain-containing protein n=1 Tax=Subtercola boreus TaxID=120213 RepID=A0A3E0W5R0_9MICO|nr:cation:proton antiporter [Subtercola boreus]RFA16808.1 hypothetical protein B7R21_01470 [Subtercola boreus]